MSKKPETLRLAEELEWQTHWKDHAAELRRLHEQNQRFYAQHASVVSDYEKAVVALKAQRDALLEALRTLLSYAFTLEMRLLDADGEHRAMQKARAAIKAAEENT